MHQNEVRIGNIPALSETNVELFKNDKTEFWLEKCY